MVGGLRGKANWLETERYASKAILLLGSKLVSLPRSAPSSEKDWRIQTWVGDLQHRDALCHAGTSREACSQIFAMPEDTDPPPL